MPYGWKGTKVRLVPLDKDKHFENCVRWVNDPAITEWLLIGDYPITRVAEEEFFEQRARTDEKDVALAIETLDEDEEHIGMTGIHNISFRDGVGTIGLFIGRTQLWNRGLGTDTIRVLTDYAFFTLGLRLILSECLDGNVGSVRIHEKNGYDRTGRIPGRYWKRGTYRDAILFAKQRGADGKS